MRTLKFQSWLTATSTTAYPDTTFALVVRGGLPADWQSHQPHREGIRWLSRSLRRPVADITSDGSLRAVRMPPAVWQQLCALCRMHSVSGSSLAPSGGWTARYFTADLPLGRYDLGQDWQLYVVAWKQPQRLDIGVVEDLATAIGDWRRLLQNFRYGEDGSILADVVPNVGHPWERAGCAEAVARGDCAWVVPGL